MPSFVRHLKLNYSLVIKKKRIVRKKKEVKSY